MEKCPFCKSPVAEDLVRFGGSCPHCFIEIPGEEAPTNPGVQPEPTAEVEASGGKGIALLIGLILLLGAGGGGLFWLSNGSEELTENDEETEFFIISASEIPEGELPGEEQDDAVAQVDPQANAGGGGYTGGYTPPANTEPTRSADDPVQPDPIQSNLAPALGPNDDPQVMPSFGVTALSDPEMIRSMVQNVINRYKGQMKHCYEQQLKSNEGLTGTWYLTFTVQTSGAVSGVSAMGKSRSNAALESCMTRRAAAWKFQPVAESQLIQQYPFRFGS